MKTALRGILIILIEIVAFAAFMFACVQLFPNKGEVEIEEFVDIDEANAGVSVEESEVVDAEQETDAEEEVPAE